MQLSPSPKPTPAGVGHLTGGALLAASGPFTRIRRWAKSIIGARAILTHWNDGPSAQPTPDDGTPVYAVLRRPDGQMMPLELIIPGSIPTERILAVAYWKAWEHPDAVAFGNDWTIEQVAARPHANQHLRTPLDALIYHQNKRGQLEQIKREEMKVRWGK